MRELPISSCLPVSRERTRRATPPWGRLALDPLVHHGPDEAPKCPQSTCRRRFISAPGGESGGRRSSAPFCSDGAEGGGHPLRFAPTERRATVIRSVLLRRSGGRRSSA